MPYKILATSKAPALIIYLLDVSGSMREDCSGKPKIEVVTDALQKMARSMVKRSTKGNIIASRYRIGMFAYSDDVVDLLGGIIPIDELAKKGIPKLQTLNMTDTAKAFAKAEEILAAELPHLDECPAPIVCHMTDGMYNGPDPAPIAQRIMAMSVPDGNVLIENIYVQDSGLIIPDIRDWQGVIDANELTDGYAKELFAISSVTPESYRQVINEWGYKIAPGARMFFPGAHPDLVELGFVMSTATPVTPAG
jgi:hypothetical protein